MRMKTDCLNSLISILIIAMTIIGITPGMVSALDNVNDGNSNSGNSSSDSTSQGSSTGDSSGQPSTGDSSSQPSTGGSSSQPSTGGSSSQPSTGGSSSQPSTGGSSSQPSTGGSSSGSSSSGSSSIKSNSVSSSIKSNSGSSSSGSSSIKSNSVSSSIKSSIGSSSGQSTVSISTDKSTIIDEASIESSSNKESVGSEDYDSSPSNSEIDNIDSNNKSGYYFVYPTNEGTYIIYSDWSYEFYPNYSGLDAIRDLYWMGDAVSEPEENIYVREHVTRNVICGYPVRFNFKENATCITHIEFEPLMTFKKTTTTAEVLMNESVFISEIPSDRIYKYTDIFVGTKGAGLPNFLKNGLVGFKVEKAWIKDNSVNESRITLKWYNKGWVSLPTKKVGEDKDYLYFESETHGFYFFAITEEEGDEVSKNGV